MRDPHEQKKETTPNNETAVQTFYTRPEQNTTFCTQPEQNTERDQNTTGVIEVSQGQVESIIVSMHITDDTGTSKQLEKIQTEAKLTAFYELLTNHTDQTNSDHTQKIKD